TIERVAGSYLEALRGLISHCKSPEAGGYTPSDFPKAHVNQLALDRLIAGIRSDKADPKIDEIEDIYPLTPMQLGMLFHSLYVTEHAVYLDHTSYALPADLDLAAFERAWQVLIERHSILRTSF